MKLATSRLLAGRKILRIDLNPFPDGRGGTAYNPTILCPICGYAAPYHRENCIWRARKATP